MGIHKNGLQRRRSYDVEIPWRRLAAIPSQIVRGGRTREGGSVTGTYGSGSRLRRDHDVEVPRRREERFPARPRVRESIVWNRTPFGTDGPHHSV